MGLDVYLRKCPDRAKAQAIEMKYEKQSEPIWKAVGKDATDKDRDKAHSKSVALAHKLGLDNYGRHPSRQDVQHDSEKYPEHHCKVGYFRSSYNGGGLNRVLERNGVPTLYDIFPHDDKGYEFVPDWDAALTVVKSAIKKMREVQKKGYDVSTVRFEPVRDPATNEQDALAIFEKALGEHKDSKDFSSFTNIQGEFHIRDPLQVRAMIKGTERMFDTTHPVMYVVYTSDLIWYLQALEIVQETIEFVLGREDKDEYFLAWSG